MMRKLLLTIQIVLFLGIGVYAQKVSFDYKYVTVGVYGNRSSWPAAMRNDNNYRYLGTSLPSYDSKNWYEIENDLNNRHIGKEILDILLERDNTGLHMDKLYEQALQNTTVEEFEVAIKDVSAETIDILKREIAHQLLKNNYVVVFQQKVIERNQSEQPPKEEFRCFVYHVEIDDRIIDQVCSNWHIPSKYDQIMVPVKLVAICKIRGTFDNENLVFKIAKKVPAFAVRAPLTGRSPITTRITKKQGAKNCDRIVIYRIKENKNGDIFSKKICTTRTSMVGVNSCRMFKIAGNLPSLKKGDIAVLKDRRKSSLSLLGDYSGGGDARLGGRLQYDYLFHCFNGGVANYLILSAGCSRYTKEPLGIWWDAQQSIQPRLMQCDFTLGYGIGGNMFGRIELMPYVIGGYSFFDVSKLNSDFVAYWDSDNETWRYKGTKTIQYGNGTAEEVSKFRTGAYVLFAGSKLSINLRYPLQIVLGADYNVNIMSESESEPNPFLDRHITNRVNVYAGLRIHF